LGSEMFGASGHRAYPLRTMRLDQSLAISAELLEGEDWQHLPDHYDYLKERKRSLLARARGWLRARPRGPTVADALDHLLKSSLSGKG
jgi:hypothetical protein